MASNEEELKEQAAKKKQKDDELAESLSQAQAPKPVAPADAQLRMDNTEDKDSEKQKDNKKDLAGRGSSDDYRVSWENLFRGLFNSTFTTSVARGIPAVATYAGKAVLNMPKSIYEGGKEGWRLGRNVSIGTQNLLRPQNPVLNAATWLVKLPVAIVSPVVGVVAGVVSGAAKPFVVPVIDGAKSLLTTAGAFFNKKGPPAPMPPTPKITPPVQQITPPQDQAPVNHINQAVTPVKIQKPQPGSLGAHAVEFFKNNPLAKAKDEEKNVDDTPILSRFVLKHYESGQAANSGPPVAANSVEKELVVKEDYQFQAAGPAAKRPKT